ncbi:PAS and ANTAR domain-containing protein [[Mycobacterium] kokjensenii]|uniref:histidine kinase n=1 Tax=[Mycobacterium] kokjensenii TaxID=3064287 RepID=A0ABM9LNF8_9MYCO|nr:PAS and ANTAR domain-containing protein [Mycolicibacter sp. MU0083]CAJ1502049.1 PAS and ANTAR domain-containing protein [Mycolicibacter sp. MU0083]
MPVGGNADDHPDADLAVLGEPQRVGRFRYWLADRRWEWSDTVARMHGYEPDAVVPSTELLLQHKHPEDRAQVAEVLKRVVEGEPFSSRHRIVDTSGQVHWVIVVGDRMLDDEGCALGTAGFYVDVSDVLQADISAGVSEVAQSRAVIEQAKGVLMVAYGISAERAFDILVWRSQETNIKVRDLAARFLAAFTGRLPSDVLSDLDHTLLTVS